MGQLGDLSPEGSVAIGVLVGVVSTGVQSFGLTLQRKSHILEDEKWPYDVRRPPHRRRRWQLGMLMFVVSNIVGSSIQITTLPLPVLSTLQASGLVFNTFFATLILGEPFTRYSVIGTFLVCAGAVLIAIFGAIGEPAHNLDQLLFLLGRRQFILWMIGTAIVVVLTIIAARALKLLVSPSRHSKPYPQQKPPLPFPPLTPNISRLRLLRGTAYGFISGILSAHSLLVAKTAVELLVRTIIDRRNQFNRWQSWLILLTLIVLALSQLYYLHRGLKLCSTSVLYPFVFCVYNIIAILDGLIYFRQGSRLSALHAGLIAVGTIILLSGVLALSWRLDDVAGGGGPSSAGAPIPPPQTPLAPGMGLVNDDRDRDRSSPSLSRYPPSDEESGGLSIPSERSPLLLSQPRRTSTHLRKPTPSGYDEAQHIMAELDDSAPEPENENENDILASLPHSPHPFLKSHKRRSRGSSLSTPTTTSAGSMGGGLNAKWRLSSGSEEMVAPNGRNFTSRRSRTWDKRDWDRRGRSVPLALETGMDRSQRQVVPDAATATAARRPRSSASSRSWSGWIPQRMWGWWIARGKGKGKGKDDNDNNGDARGGGG